jgi:hypothetical protein
VNDKRVSLADRDSRYLISAINWTAVTSPRYLLIALRVAANEKLPEVSPHSKQKPCSEYLGSSIFVIHVLTAVM